MCVKTVISNPGSAYTIGPYAAVRDRSAFLLFLLWCHFSGALRAPKTTSKYPGVSHRFSRFETILFFPVLEIRNFCKKILIFLEKNKNIDSFGLWPKTVVENVTT